MLALSNFFLRRATGSTARVSHPESSEPGGPTGWTADSADILLSDWSQVTISETPLFRKAEEVLLVGERDTEGHPHLIMSLGDLYLRRGLRCWIDGDQSAAEWFEKAESALQRALSKHSNWTNLLNMMAKVYLVRAVTIPGTAFSERERGLSMAEELLGRTAELDSSNSGVPVMLASILLSRVSMMAAVNAEGIEQRLSQIEDNLQTVARDNPRSWGAVVMLFCALHIRMSLGHENNPANWRERLLAAEGLIIASNPTSKYYTTHKLARAWLLEKRTALDGSLDESARKQLLESAREALEDACMRGQSALAHYRLTEWCQRDALQAFEAESPDWEHRLVNATETGKRGLVLHPDFTPLYLLLGDLFLDLGDRKSSDRCFERGLEQSGQGDLGCWAVGEIWRRRGDWQRAEGTYRDALRKWPFSTRLHQALASLLHAQGRAEEAAEWAAAADRVRVLDLRRGPWMVG
jgi:tetratricopeptide (TPR) repeat protein